MAIMSQQDFALMIERSARQNKQTHLEAVLAYCADNYLEPEEIAKMIEGPLKDKIRVNYAELGMLKKTASFDI
jgi:hypothetical protein